MMQTVYWLILAGCALTALTTWPNRADGKERRPRDVALTEREQESAQESSGGVRHPKPLLRNEAPRGHASDGPKPDPASLRLALSRSVSAVVPDAARLPSAALTYRRRAASALPLNQALKSSRENHPAAPDGRAEA